MSDLKPGHEGHAEHYPECAENQVKLAVAPYGLVLLFNGSIRRCECGAPGCLAFTPAQARNLGMSLIREAENAEATQEKNAREPHGLNPQ